MKIKLTADDQKAIKNFNEKFQAGLEILEKIRQFKVGDYLILYVQKYASDPLKVHVNSYGAPVKYIVIHSTPNNIPFVKKVGKNGNPIGKIYSCTGQLFTDFFADSGRKFRFEMDPDFVDSLLLQEQYNPAQLHQSKQDIWKSVTMHNKSCKILTWEINSIINFLNTVNVGDTLWRSNVSYFLVQDKQVVDRATFIKQNPNCFIKTKDVSITVLTVKDRKGKIFDVTANFFHLKSLYKERPRSYKELNI